MATPLPPDPYAALGVSKNADAGTIKTTYRKLALRCHPDKVTDESLKQQKQEEFHKIQQAYELIGDEEKRALYDAEVKLDSLRKEKAARGGNTTTETRTAQYDVRTQAPAGAQASFGARGPSRYEAPKSSSRAYDDDRDRYYESRRYDTYEAYPKHGSSRTSRSKEEPVRITKVSADRSRSDAKKSRDKEERRERSGKYAPFASVEEESSSNDEKARFEREYRRREDEEDARRRAADARRKADESRRSYDEPRRHRSSDDDDLRKQKLHSQAADAMHYIGRAKDTDARPSPNRTTSSRDVRPDYYERSSARRPERPEAVRRSSARPKDRPSSSGRDSHRDRKGIPEIVEWGEERSPPSFKQSTSSPADLHVPRATPTRSYTEASHKPHRADTSPTPAFRRSETMPSVHSMSRRKESSARPSGLRSTESASPYEPGYLSSSPPKSSYPTVPQSQPSSSRKFYQYSTPGGGVQLSPDDLGVANGHRTVTREPERYRARSPSPLGGIGRPPMGVHRTESKNIPPPPLGRSATMNVSPSRGTEERGRSRKLYGEITPDAARDRLRENARTQTSFSPDNIKYAKKYGPEDVRWSRGRDTDRDYTKPGLTRHATYVY
ncbi:DnaJ-domain-containing protein [Polyplosphaeria fusca]|uniref:DnaJ-domain-containing protein n=1 Tax=Polyplosphaeria fusca TaxID=682080 RepID=A0A9P4R4S2_9PLEO|nr:DnaJ-domain-containing protein [Polyplosphaeria fusca]